MNLMLAALLAIQPATGAGLSEGTFGWMADLAGHCWTASYPDGTRDTQCYATQYGQFLRGTIEIVAPGATPTRPPYRGDSVFVWNPDRSEMRIHFWSSTGTDGEMIGRIDGDAIVFTAGARDTPVETRAVWTRSAPDGFRVVQRRRAGETWSDVLALNYSRAAAAPERPDYREPPAASRRPSQKMKAPATKAATAIIQSRGCTFLRKSIASSSADHRPCVLRI
jgi:hypothetical protein